MGRGSGATDLAYLVGTSIADPFERAAADRPASTIDRSVGGTRGGPRHRRAVDDYRVRALSYFMAVFASMNVERTDRATDVRGDGRAVEAAALALGVWIC